jgi:hypothetical protein
VTSGQRDRLVTLHPGAHTNLPEVVKMRTGTLTPTEYVTILTALPAQHRLMAETAIGVGLFTGMNREPSARRLPSQPRSARVRTVHG